MFHSNFERKKWQGFDININVKTTSLSCKSKTTETENTLHEKSDCQEIIKELNNANCCTDNLIDFSEIDYQLPSLKVVSATFALVCFLSPNESTCQTRKNAFYFTSKALFIPKKIKF